MSNIIPAETVTALRRQVDVIIDIYGIDCTLYVPTNADTTDTYDVYVKPADHTYTTYADQKVHILWSPDQKALRKFGIFTEDNLPIIAFFKNTYKDIAGNDVNLDIIKGSYVSISFEAVPEQYDTEEFEVVDVIIRHMHDAVAVRAYKLAPRRVKA